MCARPSTVDDRRCDEARRRICAEFGTNRLSDRRLQVKVVRPRQLVRYVVQAHSSQVRDEDVHRRLIRSVGSSAPY